MCPFKFLILLALAMDGLVTATSQIVFDIVPSRNVSTCSPYCFTLFDFATEVDTSENMTLVLQPGNHNLQSSLVFENTDAFVMHSRTNEAIITCNQSGIIKFINVSTVHLLNLTFSECGSAIKTVLEFQFVDNGLIDQCSMRRSNGSIVHSYQSIITIKDTLLTNMTSKNGAISLEASTIMSIKH